MPEENPHARDGRGGTSFAAASAVDSGREWSQIRAVCCAAGPPASFARAGFADGTPAGEKKKKNSEKRKPGPIELGSASWAWKLRSARRPDFL